MNAGNAGVSWIRSAGLLIPLICLAYYVTSESLLTLGAVRDVLTHGQARQETILLSSAQLGDVGNIGVVLSAVMVGLVGWLFVALIRARFGPTTRPAMLAGVVLVFGFAWASWVVPGRYVAVRLAGMGYERCGLRDVIQGASEGMVAVSRSGSRVRRYDAWTRPGSCREG